MEEIISNIYYMWGIFWQEATPLEKAGSIANMLGSFYTFVIGFILFHKVDLIQENIFDLNHQIIKSSLVAIMIGCFFSLLAVRSPILYEVVLHTGLTILLTYLLHLVIKTEKAHK